MSIEKTSSSYLRKSKLPYEIVYRHVLSNLKNSDALAVWCHLTSKPDNWEINESYLGKHFGWGRDKVRKAFRCLIINNLMSRIQLMKENGQFGDRITQLLDGHDFVEYIQYDKTIHKNITKFIQKYEMTPLTEKPFDGFTVDGKQVSTEYRVFKEEKKKQKIREVTPQKIKISDKYFYNDKHYEMAKKFGLDIAFELEEFIDYWKGNGEKKIDWDATFSNWLRKSYKWSNKNKSKVTINQQSKKETAFADVSSQSTHAVSTEESIRRDREAWNKIKESLTRIQ